MAKDVVKLRVLRWEGRLGLSRQALSTTERQMELGRSDTQRKESDVMRGMSPNGGAPSQEVPAATRGWEKQATILP